MPGKIKGITIEFRGETTQLNKALKTVETEARKATSKLKSIDNALKFNPRNVELLAQKEQVLGQRVTQTKEKLNALRAAQAKMDADPSVNKKSAEYQKLRRDIIVAESQLKNFTKQMILFGKARFNAVGQGLQNVGRKLTSVTRGARMAAGALAGMALYKGFERLKTLDEVSTTLQKLGYEGQHLENIMDAAKQSVSGTRFALTDMAKVAQGALGSGVESQYAIGDYLSRVADLAQISGISVQQMGAMMNKALSKGTVDARLLNQMNANGIPIYTLLAQHLGVTTDELQKMVRTGQVGFDDLYQATAKYDGLAAEMGTNTLSGAVTVLGQQFGLMGADFLNGAYEPIKEGVQGIVSYLKKLQAQGTIKEWGNAVGETIKALVGWFKTGELSMDGMSSKGKAITTALYPIVSVVGTLVKAFMALPMPIKQLIAVFTLLGGPILTFAGGIIKVVGIVQKAVAFIRGLQGVLMGARVALAALSGPIGWIAAAIAAAIAIGIALYKNWDVVKAKAIAFKNAVATAFGNLKNTISSAFGNIKDKMVKPFTTAYTLIRNAINRIKGIFKGLKLNLPKIKLPHFSVKGGKAPWGFGGKGRMPSVSVKWYKTGGIFDRPTLAGIGEAGPEAVVPLSGNQMQPFARAIADNMNGGGIDYDALALAIVNAMNAVSTPVIINMDGRKVAEIQAPFVNTAINRLQSREARQLGIVGV